MHREGEHPEHDPEEQGKKEEEEEQGKLAYLPTSSDIIAVHLSNLWTFSPFVLFDILTADIPEMQFHHIQRALVAVPSALSGVNPVI